MINGLPGLDFLVRIMSAFSLAGMVFSVLLIAGFRSTVLLAEETEEITVQAPERSMDRDDVEGGTSRRIDLQDSRTRNRDLPEVLEREASVRVKRYGGAGAYSTLSIRGSNANQVNVYINGIPLNNAVTGEVNLSDLDIRSMDSIEIHRGTAMLLSNPTVGGAVNLKTSDRSCGHRVYVRGGSFRTFGAGFFISDSRNWDTGSQCRPASEETSKIITQPEAPADESTGSTDSASDNLTTAQAKKPKYNPGTPGSTLKPGDFWYSIGGGGEMSDQNFLFRNENGTPVINSFDDFDDRRKNAQYRKASLTATAGLFALGTRFDLLNDFFYREHGVPGPGSNQTEKTWRKHLRNTTGFTSDTKAAGWSRLRFKSRLYYTEVRNHFFDPEQEFSFQFPGSKNRLQQTGIHLMPEIHLPEYYQTLKFLLGNQREVYHEDERNALDQRAQKKPTKFRNQSSIHIVDEFSFFKDALQIHPFGRFERYVDRFNEPATAQDPLKESAVRREFLDPGIRIRGRIFRNDVMQLHLRAAAYRSRRVPLFVELFGESGSIVSNPDLKAEDAETYEAGVDFQYIGFLELQTSLTFFQRNVRDMIIFVPNSRFSLRAENVDAAEIKGVETGLKASWHWLEVYGNYTYQEAINRGDIFFSRGKYLPLRPLHDFNAGLTLTLGDFRPGAEASYTGAVFKDRSNDFFFYQEPRWLYNAFLEYSVFESRDHALDFIVEVRNVLNDRAEDIVGYPIPGRSVYASLNYRF
ncbi:MAG: TonB-dependent receptor [Leptospiraceae bacterium]